MRSIAHLVGCPYEAGGRDPKNGIDCLGLLLEYGAMLGWTRERMLAGVSVIDGDPPNGGSAWREVAGAEHPGDVAYWRPLGESSIPHVAVFVGGGRWLSATRGYGSHLLRSKNVIVHNPRFYRFERGGC